MFAKQLVKAGATLAPKRILVADQHPVVVYLARLGRRSKRVQRQALRKIADILSKGTDIEHVAWCALRYQHTAAIRAILAEDCAPATANRILSALRGVLKECWRLGQIDTNDYRLAVDIEPVRGSTLLAGRALTGGEIAVLFGTCEADTSAAGPRDAALFSLLYAVGLRRSEAVAVDLADYDSEIGELRVRRGKGSKDRTVWLNQGAQGAVDAWLQRRGDKPGPLLYPVRKGGKIEPRRMTDQAAFSRLGYRARKAGIASCSPHDLRRTFISDLFDRGADIATVQYLAGHSNTNTTTRYDRRPEEAKRKAVGLLHVPYRPPKNEK